jgi:hypothetical protein
VWKKALGSHSQPNGSCAFYPYDSANGFTTLLGLSPPLPDQAPGPVTWNLLEKSSFMKSKTCIIGSKFFTFYYLIKKTKPLSMPIQEHASHLYEARIQDRIAVDGWSIQNNQGDLAELQITLNTVTEVNTCQK